MVSSRRGTELAQAGGVPSREAGVSAAFHGLRSAHLWRPASNCDFSAVLPHHLAAPPHDRARSAARREDQPRSNGAGTLKSQRSFPRSAGSAPLSTGVVLLLSTGRGFSLSLEGLRLFSRSLGPSVSVPAALSVQAEWFEIAAFKARLAWKKGDPIPDFGGGHERHVRLRPRRARRDVRDDPTLLLLVLPASLHVLRMTRSERWHVVTTAERQRGR